MTADGREPPIRWRPQSAENDPELTFTLDESSHSCSSAAGRACANGPSITHVRLALLVARAVRELHRDESVALVEAAGPGVALERPKVDGEY